MDRLAGGLLPFAFIALLAGCSQPGAESAANVYDASQVNQRQEAKVVNILAVTPSRVQVSNAQNQRTAQIAGGIFGALAGGTIGNNIGRPTAFNTLLGGTAGGATGVAAGSLVPGQVLVEGVSLTYEEAGHTYSSAQVGRLCEFQPGKALMFSTGGNETRIQSNATCPAPAAAKA